MSDTLLVISGALLPPWSARGLTQTLEFIEAAGFFRRTVNGTLHNLAPAQLQLYRSVISCTDQRVPAIDGIWPGDVVTVDCVVELAYVTAGGSAARTAVPGSPRIEGDYTFYRPRLTMQVITCPMLLEEWQASVGWELELEEQG